MPRAFICYSRESREAVTQLAADIDALGHDAWFDQELSGGQAWWAQILSRIRDADMVIVALSPAFLDSVACRREYTYAAELGRPILPILIAEGVPLTLVPPALSAIQMVDLRASDRDGLLSLARAITMVPAAGPLPETLPEPPDVPLSYLGGLRERIEAPPGLSLPEQSTLVIELKIALRDPDTRADALTLVAIFRRRADLLATIAVELDEVERWVADPPAAPRPEAGATADAEEAAEAGLRQEEDGAAEARRKREAEEAAEARRRREAEEAAEARRKREAEEAAEARRKSEAEAATLRRKQEARAAAVARKKDEGRAATDAMREQRSAAGSTGGKPARGPFFAAVIVAGLVSTAFAVLTPQTAIEWSWVNLGYLEGWNPAPITSALAAPTHLLFLVVGLLVAFRERLRLSTPDLAGILLSGWLAVGFVSWVGSGATGFSHWWHPMYDELPVYVGLSQSLEQLLSTSLLRALVILAAPVVAMIWLRARDPLSSTRTWRMAGGALGILFVVETVQMAAAPRFASEQLATLPLGVTWTLEVLLVTTWALRHLGLRGYLPLGRALLWIFPACLTGAFFAVLAYRDPLERILFGEWSYAGFWTAAGGIAVAQSLIAAAVYLAIRRPPGDVA